MLGNAFVLMRRLLQKLEAAQQPYSDRLLSLEANYRYVVDYYLSGQDDPHRSELIDQLVREGFILLDEIYLAVRKQELTTYEFTEMLRPHEGFDTPDKAFLYFWLNQMESWHYDMLLQLCADREMEIEAMMGLSGLTLNLLRSFRVDGLLCLMHAAEESYPTYVRERAWVGLLLVMLAYDDRLLFFPEVQETLLDLMVTEDGQVFARTALTCLVRTQGVAWASSSHEKLESNLMPFLKNLPKDEPVQELDINQLSERFEQDLEDVLDEYRDEISMQFQEHLDVQFASFRDMYSSAFFAFPWRWFLPYDPMFFTDEMRKASPAMSGFFQHVTDLCASDYYAFLSVISNMASFQKMVENLGEQMDPMDSDNDNVEDRLLCNGYVKQLYRFFVLNPWHIDNAISLIDDLHKSLVLRLINPSALEKKITADNLFGCHAWQHAAAIYEQILETLHTPEVYEKYAYTLQCMENYSQAVCFYDKIGDSASRWARQQKRFCLEQLEQYDTLLGEYDSLLQAHPEDETYLYKKGVCLEHLELYAEALDVFYKLDLYHPGRPQVERAIAWCTFMTDDYDTSEQYFTKLQAQGKMLRSDLLNYGHLCFAKGLRMEAFQQYQLALRQSQDRVDFLKLFRPDRHFLLEKGISKQEIYLMEDQLITIQ